MGAPPTADIHGPAEHAPLPDRSLAKTARRWRVPPAELHSAAVLGRFPPQIAWPLGDPADGWGGWRFSSQARPKDWRPAMAGDVVHVPSVPSDVAQITVGLCSSNDAMLADVLGWCRFAAPDPLDATPHQLAWWCTRHPDDTTGGAPPRPTLAARRFESVSAWLAALTDAGVGHSGAADGLGLRIDGAAAPG